MVRLVTKPPSPLPSDATLTQDGLNATGQGRVLVIACGALAREIIDLKTANKWDHLDLTCLPAILHNHPERITDAVSDTIAKHKADYHSMYVAYADCGTGGLLEKACEELGVEMIKGPHCYSFFEGNDAFAAHDDEITAFYLTDFLTRQFDAFVWKPLGLDKHPELRDAYFGHYTKLVFQSQTNDPALLEKAKECAEKLDLAFEHRVTGYGDLSNTLADWAERAR